MTISAERSPLIEHANGSTERLYKIGYTVSAVNEEVSYNFELVCNDLRSKVFDETIVVLKGDSDSKTGGLIHLFYSESDCTKAALHIISGASQYNNLDNTNRLEVPFVLTEQHTDFVTGSDVGDIPGLWSDVDYTAAIESGEVTEEEVEESEETQSQTANYP